MRHQTKKMLTPNTRVAFIVGGLDPLDPPYAAWRSRRPRSACRPFC